MFIHQQSTRAFRLWPFSRAEVRAFIFATLTSVAIVATVGASFIWGQLIGRNDARLLAADDAHHIHMLARSCGAHGQLWRSPQTGNYACIYASANGAVMVESIPDKPYLPIAE